MGEWSSFFGCVFRVASVVLCGVAVACSVLVVLTCDFVTTNSVKAGLFSQSFNNQTCVHYPTSIDVDPYWLCARIFAIAAIVAGAGAFFLLLLDIVVCQVFGGCLTSFLFSAAQGAQGLTLLFFNSDLCRQSTCTISNGAILCIAALVIYLLAGVLECIAPKSEPLCPLNKQRDGQ